MFIEKFWQEKLGNHMAFHENETNFYLHLLGTPLMLLGLFTLLSVVKIEAFGLSADAGQLVGAGLFLFYFSIHKKVALFYGPAFLLIQLIIAQLLVPWFPVPYLLAAGLGLFTLGFILQVPLGHGVFEKGSNNLNNEFQEFFETGNPVIFLFIFFFPYLHLYFRLGFEKETFAKISLYKHPKN